jgi:hypothetical protein
MSAHQHHVDPAAMFAPPPRPHFRRRHIHPRRRPSQPMEPEAVVAGLAAVAIGVGVLILLVL